MDSFATSQSFRHAVFSRVLSIVSARRTSADSRSPFLPRRKDVAFEKSWDRTPAGGGWACGNPVHWEAVRSSENRRIDRLNRLNSETDWPPPPQVTDIPANPRLVIYLLSLNQRGTRVCPRFNIQPGRKCLSMSTSSSNWALIEMRGAISSRAADLTRNWIGCFLPN